MICIHNERITDIYDIVHTLSPNILCRSIRTWPSRLVDDHFTILPCIIQLCSPPVSGQGHLWYLTALYATDSRDCTASYHWRGNYYHYTRTSFSRPPDGCVDIMRNQFHMYDNVGDLINEWYSVFFTCDIVSQSVHTLLPFRNEARPNNLCQQPATERLFPLLDIICRTTLENHIIVAWDDMTVKCVRLSDDDTLCSIRFQIVLYVQVRSE